MSIVTLDPVVRNLDKTRTFEVTKDHYWIDDGLRSNLDIMKKAVILDWDFVIGVDGIERSGKSVFAQQIGYYLDPDLTLDRIVFSPKEFEKACLTANKYDVIIWDEAITGADIKDTMEGINKTLMKMLGQIGQKNLFIIIVLPSFYDLTRYIALFRCKIIFNKIGRAHV